MQCLELYSLIVIFTIIAFIKLFAAWTLKRIFVVTNCFNFKQLTFKTCLCNVFTFTTEKLNSLFRMLESINYREYNLLMGNILQRYVCSYAALLSSAKTVPKQAYKTFYCMMLKSDEKLAYIYGINENGNRIKAYLDCGSELSILSLNSITDRNKIQPAPNINLLSATGHALQLVGKYKLQIVFGDLSLSVPCIVVSSFPYDLLLSISIFKSLKADLNFGKNTCEFYKHGLSSGILPIYYDRKNSSINVANSIRVLNSITPYMNGKSLLINDVPSICLKFTFHRKYYVFFLCESHTVLPGSIIRICLPKKHVGFKMRQSFLNLFYCIGGNDEYMYLMNHKSTPIELRADTYVAKSFRKMSHDTLQKSGSISSNHFNTSMASSETSLGDVLQPAGIQKASTVSHKL